MSRDDETVELELQEHHRTKDAILVSDNGEENDAVWLPFSQIDIRLSSQRNNLVTLLVPEWLAKAKGLI